MKSSQLAAQLYTVREFTKTTDDFADTMAKVRKIGYESVQISAIGEEIKPEDVAQIAKENGLTICATHESAKSFFENLDGLIARLKAMGCTRTAYPWPHILPATYNGMVQFAKKMNGIAEKMAASGIELSYHNHDIEFRKYDGKILLDILYNEAPALKAEIDTFWIQAGGHSPEKWIKKLAGRQTLLHLKDYGIAPSGRVIRHIGAGNLDWDAIIKAGEDAGVQYFIVEQDDCYGLNPFDELKSSFDFISTHFFN